MFSRAWVGRRVLLGLILLGCFLLSSAQDPTGSKKVRFGGGYDSLEPAQQELVQKWHGEYEAITGRTIDAKLSYDNLPLLHARLSMRLRMVPTSVKPSSSFYQFLARYQLPRDPGTEWEYSNLGYWLLGEALANRAGMSYETALQTRVLAPLRLANTAFIPSPRMKDKLSVGHDAALQRAPAWNQLSMYADLQAAGGLISTTNDLLTFLAATLGYDKSPLSPAMAAMLTVRRPISGPDVAQALGWVVAGKGDEQLIVHEGGTWGYASSVAWDPKARIGVVVLSNQLTSVDDIARHLLRPNIPLAKVVSAVHSEIALTSTTLDSYIGRYEGRDGETFIVGREGDYLKIKLPSDWGLPNLRVRPETHTRFFVSELPLRLEFETDANGQVAGMLVYPPRGQRALHTTRVSSSK